MGRPSGAAACSTGNGAASNPDGKAVREPRTAALDGCTEISTDGGVGTDDEDQRGKLECAFFRTEQGKEPVREWLRSLPVEAKKEVGSDIERVQWRWPVSKPLVDGLGGGLYEVRTRVERVQYRVLFCIVESTMVLLHGFVKKSRVAPAEIAVGRDRQKAVIEAAPNRGKPRRT
jgi:phage-related protein